LRRETPPATALLAVAMAAIMGLLALLAGGCRQNMHNQPKVEPYEESDFFPDGMGSRPLPAGTVARGLLREDAALYTGLDAQGRAVASFPLPVTRQLLRRGQERFNIYCSPCHDRAGTGRGMIVQRGYKQPSSYHIDRLRQAPPGYFYDVMTRGFGVMPSYAAQVAPEDRWAIVAYIRALQLSQDASLAALTQEERARLQQAWRQPPVGPAERSGHPAEGGERER
jgi:mono/diheme cytochrome c family protein